MPTIYVEGSPYEVPVGQNLLHACISLGFNLPYFCWHPAMHSVGACRQCAVKQFRDENDTRGRIIMACMTPATEGARISIDDPQARAFRAGVIEWLMESHPHDCPVCDEGGECHLQDMTVMTGHAYRRFRFKKRTYRNQYLGPFINHEMNRCIQCYRCVRYYLDYAGGRDLNVFAAHNHVYFGRFEDGVLESPFAGNLVEVCPTGVFTDRTLSNQYTRKWDLETAPSICVHCSVGCNTIPGARYTELRRIVNRYNGEVNGYFLCDRGRFGYDFVNSDRRILRPIYRRGVPATAAGAAPAPETGERLAQVAGALLSSGARMIGIGSPRASLESNFALRALVGADNFYSGLSQAEHELIPAILAILRMGPAASPSLREIRASDAVLVLGEDLQNFAPVVGLGLRQAARQQPMREAMRKLRIPRWDGAAIRQAMQDAHGPFFVITPGPTDLDGLATDAVRAAPDDIARLGFAVAAALRGDLVQLAGVPEWQRDLTERMAAALSAAEKPLIISGSSLGNESVVRAAAAVAWELCDAGRRAGLSFVFSECNSLGAGMMGGGSLRQAFDAVSAGDAEVVVILENDLFRRAVAADVEALFREAKLVIALDHLANATTDRAGLVLPAATFAEGDGTLVNQEGRAQRFFQVLAPKPEVRESWRWLRDLMIASGRAPAGAWPNLDAVTAAMVAEFPEFAPVAEIAPPSTYRIAGQKIARDSYRYSGRTAMNANVDVSEPKPPDDPDSALAFSMEGVTFGPVPPALVPRFWAPGWNSWQQSVSKFQSEVAGPLVGGDPGKRLVEAGATRNRPVFREVPEPFLERAGELLVVPFYHVFGSEELSVLSPGIAQLSPGPYLAVGGEDAQRYGLRDGASLELPLGGQIRKLTVRVVPSLPRGMAGIPAGLPSLAGVVLPAWVRIGNRE